MKTAMTYLLYGAGSLFNIFGVPTGNPYSSRSDADALRSDWEHIGIDFKKAISLYENQ